MPLGMEVGPGDFVFDGDPAIPETEGTPTTTQFLAHVYCGHGCPSQLLLSCCTNGLPKILIVLSEHLYTSLAVQEINNNDVECVELCRLPDV